MCSIAARSSAGVKVPSTIRSMRSASGGGIASNSVMIGCLEFSGEIGKFTAESVAGAVETGLDGPYSDAEPIGQLARAVAFSVLQDEELCIAYWQATESLLD